MNLVAEDEGFEPPQTESESGVLPLHKSSIWNSFIICNYPKKSSTFFKFLQIIFLLQPEYFQCQKSFLFHHYSQGKGFPANISFRQEKVSFSPFSASMVRI